MCNHTAVAKAFVVAACTLAIALLTIGMSVNSTWAETGQPSERNFTSIASKSAPARTGQKVRANRMAQACIKSGDSPGEGQLCYKCCSGVCAVNTCSSGGKTCKCQ